MDDPLTQSICEALLDQSEDGIETELRELHLRLASLKKGEPPMKVGITTLLSLLFTLALAVALRAIFGREIWG